MAKKPAALVKGYVGEARSFDEVFSDIARRLREAEKTPAKAQFTLRLDQRV